MLLCLFLSLPSSAKLLIRLNSVCSFVFSTLALTLQTASRTTIRGECWLFSGRSTSLYLFILPKNPWCPFGDYFFPKGSLSVRGPGEQGVSPWASQRGQMLCSEHWEQWESLETVDAHPLRIGTVTRLQASRPIHSPAVWRRCLFPYLFASLILHINTLSSYFF